MNENHEGERNRILQFQGMYFIFSIVLVAHFRWARMENNHIKTATTTNTGDGFVVAIMHYDT